MKNKFVNNYLDLVTNNYFIIVLLCLMVYFRPADYVIGSVVYEILSYCMVLLFLFFSLTSMLLFQKKKFKFHLGLILFLFSFFWVICISTFFNFLKGNEVHFANSVLTFSTIAGFIVMSEIGMQFDCRKYLKYYILVGMIVCSLNAISFILFRDSGGLRTDLIEHGRQLSNSYYLLAEDNATFFWTYPVFIIGWLYYFSFNKSKQLLCINCGFSLLMLVSYFYVWSVMALLSFGMGGAFILIAAFIQSKRPTLLNNRGSYYFPFLAGFGTTLLFAVFKVQFYFESFIWNTFHKSVTFSGRTYIWDKSMEYFMNAPLIGYGNENVEVTIGKLGINHTHNFLLEILYRGGLIGLFLFLVSFYLIGKKAKQAKGHFSYFIFCGLLTIFLVSLTIEFAFYRYIYVVLFLIPLHPEIFISGKKG